MLGVTGVEPGEDNGFVRGSCATQLTLCCSFDNRVGYSSPRRLIVYNALQVPASRRCRPRLELATVFFWPLSALVNAFKY